MSAQDRQFLPRHGMCFGSVCLQDLPPAKRAAAEEEEEDDEAPVGLLSTVHVGHVRVLV